MECFNTCGLLGCLHLYVSLCCVSHAEGQTQGIRLSLQYGEIIHLFPDDCKAQNYNYNGIIVISMEDKTYCPRHWVSIISVCGLIVCLINHLFYY